MKGMQWKPKTQIIKTLKLEAFWFCDAHKETNGEWEVNWPV